MDERGSILIEIMPVTDKAFEVIAIDSETGCEVRFPVPAHTSETSIKKLAAQKLAYVQNKAEKTGNPAEDLEEKPPRKDSRGGIIV